MSVEEFSGEEAFPTFELLPADSEDFTPDEELAAIASLTDPADLPDVVTADEDEPLGKTWKMNHETGRLERYGTTPVPVSGLDSVAEWCLIALRITRYQWPVVPDEVGMEDPYRPIGFIDETEMRAQYAADVRETLLVHDRVTAVKDFQFVASPDDPEVLLVSAKVIVDEESVVDLERIPLELVG